MFSSLNLFAWFINPSVFSVFCLILKGDILWKHAVIFFICQLLHIFAFLSSFLCRFCFICRILIMICSVVASPALRPTWNPFLLQLSIQVSTHGHWVLSWRPERSSLLHASRTWLLLQRLIKQMTEILLLHLVIALHSTLSVQPT